MVQAVPLLPVVVYVAVASVVIAVDDDAVASSRASTADSGRVGADR